MEDLVITTEESHDLSSKMIEQLGIKVCAVDYYVDGYEFNSQTNHVEPKEFYENMRKGADVKTTQVNQQNAHDFLESILKTGKTILHVSFSSGLSGTYQSFCYAAQDLNKKYPNKCFILDSLSVSGGQGLLLTLISKKAKEENMTIEKLFDYCNQIKCKINHIFTVDDLKYLVKGGRVSKASAKIAGLLHIKPLLKVDNDGKLVATGKVIGRRLAIKKLFETMIENYDPHFADIYISHADSEEDAKKLANMIFDYYGLTAQILPLDFFIGAHSGPGTLALFFVGEKR